jgi:4-carboxymuconolactone decarboxylase
VSSAPPPDDEASRILDRHKGSTAGSPLADHPQLRHFLEVWLDTFILHGRVDPRLRQLTILRVAWRCNQPFEWANHYRRAIREGVTDQDVLSIRTPDPARLGGPVGVVVRAADEVVDLGLVSPSTYASCAEVFPDPAVLHEWLHLAAGYRMMATILNTTNPSVEEAGLPWWPPDGVAPV